MMHESSRDAGGRGVVVSKRKPSDRKRGDHRIGMACIEVLESRFLLSGTTQVIGTPSPGAENVLTAITSGETTPTQGTFTDFGNTAPGVVLIRNYTITNTNSTALNLTGPTPISITGDTNDFTVQTQPVTLTIAPNSTATFAIQFSSTGAGNDTATISIASDDPAGPFTFEVSAESLAGVTTATDGLITKTTSNGTGSLTTANGELLLMNYTGYLTDGTIFDSNTNPATPFEFVLGQGQVIAGWDQGLAGMKAGEQRTLIIPAALAYGSGGQGAIPPNAELIFTTTLVNALEVSGTSNTLIPNGDTTPSANDGTDFGSVNFITAPPVTHTFTLSGATGLLSSVLANPAVSVTGSTAFSVTQPTLSAGVATFAVKYTPSVGAADATVTITNGSSGKPNMTFEVQAQGPSTSTVATMTVKGNNSSATSPITTGENSPNQTTWTDFGPTASDGSVPVTRQYTITNTGNATLDLTGSPLISLSGADASDFSVSVQPSSTVGANSGTTNFTITFTPRASGTRTATVTIASNDPNGPFTFEIQGEALATTTSADGLKTVTTVAGTGTGAAVGELLIMNYTGYLTDGTKFDSSLNPGRTPFQFILGQGSVIQGWDEGLVGMKLGEQRTLIIPASLAYGAAGNGSVPANATLIFTTTLVDIVSVAGVVGGQNVVIPSGESVASTANGTDFGTHLLADAPVTHTFVVTDAAGNIASVLAGSAVTIAGSPAFQITQPTVNGNTATFTVTYTPSNGQTAAGITLHNAAAGQPNLVFGVQARGPIPANSGTGPELTLIGDNIFASIPILSGSTATNAQQIWTNFGTTAIGGSTSVTRTYKITNAGTTNLVLSGGTPVTISGEGAADFTVTSQPSTLTLAPGASTDFTISFHATAAGNRGAVVTIASNDTANPFTFLIAGTGMIATTTSDGLQTGTTTPGWGNGAQNGDVLVIDYSGYLLDGTEFDSSLFPGRSPFQFTLGKGQVIQGWDEGLVGMKIGESRTLIIPASLAYGSSGQGSIPANATLVFTTTLLNIVSVSGVVNSADVFIPSGNSTPATTDGTEFGFVGPNNAAVTHTFVITAPNGSLSAYLAANPVSLTGAGAQFFTMSQPVYNAANTQATFTITFPPDATGTSSATVLISNSTAGSPNLSFNVQGEGPAGADGSIAVANMDDISGFAYNPLNVNDTLNIKITFSDGPTFTIPANQANTSVQNLIGSPNHGFDLGTPVLTVGQHTVTIDAIDTSNGTVTLLGTATVTSQNSLFDEHYYDSTNPDVAAAIASGAIATGYDHYIKYGQFEGRSPSPFWDESFYLASNPDVAAAVADGKISSGFMHYYLYGQFENRPGLLYFNENYYLDNNPDVATAVADGEFSSGFEHFVLFGQYENRSPMLYFNSSVYKADNPDITPYVNGEPFLSDYEHFVEYGQYEGRTASNFFNEQTYLQDNPDVLQAVLAGKFPTGFQHWLRYGQFEGRTAV